MAGKVSVLEEDGMVGVLVALGGNTDRVLNSARGAGYLFDIGLDCAVWAHNLLL